MKKIKVLKTLHALIAGRHLIMPHIFTEHIIISVTNVPTTAQVAIEKLLCLYFIICERNSKRFIFYYIVFVVYATYFWTKL